MTRFITSAAVLAALLSTPAMADEPVTAAMGTLTLDAGFARATLPGAPVAGGFLSIENAGDSDDRLVAATSPASGRVEIHEMAMDGDVMRMRELPDGLSIPAGETVLLEPGGYHLMLMDLAGPLVEGESVEVTLTFEQAGETTITLPIGAMNASTAASVAQGSTGESSMDHGETN